MARPARMLLILGPIVAAMVVVQFTDGAARTVVVVVAGLLAMLGVRIAGPRR